jgi:hypothetical protein
MIHIHRTAHKSTGGHLTIGQLVPYGTLCQQEEPVEPHQLEFVELSHEESVDLQHEEHVIHS